MKTSIKVWHMTACAVLLAFLGIPLGFAASAQYDYQRYITFKNDFTFPIYPVIQVPEDNCVAGSLRDRRIIVNGKGHLGLKSGELITVLLPKDDKEKVTLEGVEQWANCWYRSGRVYVFGVELDAYEKAAKDMDPNNATKTTNYTDSRYPKKTVTCFLGPREKQGTSQAGDCYTGVADASFDPDAPAQLAEYTFDSDFPDVNPPQKTPPADTGIPMADIDISNVDDLYLPIAGSVFNHGASGYMGSAMTLADFKKRVQAFWSTKTNGGWRWPTYAAYQKNNWLVNTFSDLMPNALGGKDGTNILEHLPGGYNIINNTLGQPISTNYFPGGTDPHYLLTNVKVNKQANTPPTSGIVNTYVTRWMSWINADPCTDTSKLIWPDNITAAFDKTNFCQKFRDNVRYVWKHFLTDAVDGYNDNKDNFYKDCGLYGFGFRPPAKGLNDTAKACIIQHIVGYNSKVLSGELPGRIQAALRSVAYDPDGDGKQYQFDPFLTFAAPYDSQFTLDPYTRLIHSTRDGVGAVAYSFSIDDKYGNFRDASSGFIIDAGGVSALENKAPYDPYQLYKAIWGYNPSEYILVWLANGTEQSGIQAQLLNISAANGNRAILVKQGSALWLLAQTADGGLWKWVKLATQDYLQGLADKEKEQSKGKEDYFQQLIDHTFGNQSAFPKTQLNTDGNAISFLKFDTDPTWNFGKLKLYELIGRSGSYQSGVNNWVKAELCGHPLDIRAGGGQSIAFSFADGAYQPCDIKLEDSRGDQLVLSLTPAQTTVTDTYTGADAEVWGLPHGKNAEGQPPISHTLSDADIQYCRQNSSSDLAVLGTCNLIRVSANWADDSFARDTVYMGLAFQDMPRVNLNLPSAPLAEVDPDGVYFPVGSKISVTGLTTAEVTAKWPAASVKSGKPVKYELTLWQQTGANQDQGKDKPTFQSVCAQDKDQNNQPINLKTFCRADIPAAAAGSKWYFRMVAINYTASPVKQSDPLSSSTFTYPALPKP